MEYSITTQQLAEVLEQQRKLKSIEELILKQIDQVNQTINYLTVEEFQLQTCEIEQKTDIDLKKEEPEPSTSSSVIKIIQPVVQLIVPEEINNQTIDLDINEFQSGAYEVDEDEDF